MGYKHTEIDKKWQKKWQESETFKASVDKSRPKYYALDMFPYPSGAGLHIGHMASYTPTDIIARFKRATGFNVLHPMGWDAFGLPAEQYAIQTGVHPAITTQKAIDNFREQMKSFGFSFDWNRELSTADSSFYKWTQFVFLKLYEKGLAYQKEVPVNWCPALKTVLANEEVVDGKSERGGHPVIRQPMKQWMLKITAYAERLIADLDKVDWPERTKEAQKNWIGKSEGALANFKIEGHSESLEVFTTRPDTLFGVTFMVMAPEHPLVEKITAAAQKKDVEAYQKKAAAKSEVDRKANTEKTGVFTGAHVIHPVSGEKIQIWLSDYVLMDYGTGAIMAVPGHDSRDFEFATQFKLPIVRVLEGGDLPFEGEGQLVNSQFLNGMSKTEAIGKMIAYLESKHLGKKQVQFKFRDWLFSRQRYWGEPFPIVHLNNGNTVGVAIDELPISLPEVADYEPTESGEAPLGRIKEWVTYRGKMGEGRRETDTMPGSAGSSWYFLRYCDPHNQNEPYTMEAQKYWMPVDIYVGGPEHTVGHLLYSRFWQKVLFDCGLATHDEPFKKLAHQGMILGPDGEKMSKSRGNVVNPDEVRENYGADAIRLFICFLGPMDKDKPWNPNGIDGVRRFLDRLWRLTVNDDGTLAAKDEKISEEIERLLHKTIKKVTEDYESLSFNTAISAMMIFVNELYKHEVRSKTVLKILAQLLMPIGPHLAEELWERLEGEGFVSLAPWPKHNPDMIKDETVTMGIQVNGKMRGTIDLSPNASEEEAVKLAKSNTAVTAALEGKVLDKVIYRPGRILNLIVKG
ncbi:MAG: leucine--tRNA ligase [Pseudobdellovibrionaceae bacterium]